MRNVYFDLTEEFNAGGPIALLASGQAVVYYRLAIMSKDGDRVLRERPDACRRVLEVLEPSRAKPIECSGKTAPACNATSGRRRTICGRRAEQCSPRSTCRPPRPGYASWPRSCCPGHLRERKTPMRMLSEDDLDLRGMTDEELAAAWDLWFDLAQATNDFDPDYTHGVFVGCTPDPAVDEAKAARTPPEP